MTGDEETTTTERVERLQGALVVAIASSCLAVALGVPALFTLSIVALGFVLVGYASGPPGGSVTLERSLSDDRPRPGQPVTVSLSVTNESDRVAADVRVVDQPPADVAVVEGDPAFATAIRPGETVTYEYDLAPPRGEYVFGSPTVRRRNVASTVHRTRTCDPDGETSFTCETLLDTFPFQEQTIQFVGRTPTDDGGSGVEFYATREYRRGDPINRIDWHRLARTGDLATVEYREERAVTIVFVIDDRADVHWRAPGGGPDSFDLSLYAASRGVVASLEDGNRTGFTMLSADVWVDPGTGSDVRRRVEDALAEHGSTRSNSNSSSSSSSSSSTDAGTGTPSSSPSTRLATDGAGTGDADRASALARDLVHRLPADAQVVLCTPLSDSLPIHLVRSLRSRGRAATVVSPDMTTGVAGSADETHPSTDTDRGSNGGLGARITALERENRIAECRGLGAAVVDWDLGDPISVDLARVLRAGRRSR